MARHDLNNGRRIKDGQKRVHGFSEREVTQRLVLAIFEQRLPPGQRITESQLCEAFNVSRTVIRESMARLSEIGVFTKTPNQGCTIAAPTRADAQHMLQVRQMIEPEIARSLSARRTERDLAILKDHLAQEDAARGLRDRPTLLRLTGEFHLKLAEMDGNPYLVRLITEMQVLTCLAVLVHADAEIGCPRDEHSTIVNAIEHGDGEAAAAEMLHHLLHIREELHLDRSDPETNLENAMLWLSKSSA